MPNAMYRDGGREANLGVDMSKTSSRVGGSESGQNGETVDLVSGFKRIRDAETREHVIRYVRALADIDIAVPALRIAIEFDPSSKAN